MLNCNYLVAEDNAGRLFLFITDNNNITLHAYTGFECNHGSLMNALHDLQNDAEAYNLWENDIVELHGKDAYRYCLYNFIDVIKYKGMTFTRCMGTSARLEFSLNDKKVECDRIYVHSIDTYVVCDSMRFDSDLHDITLYREGRVVSIIGGLEGKEIVTYKDEKKITFFRIEGGMFYEVI